MICRFVDGIAGSTILDLNDQVNYWYLDGSEFPMPEMIYSWVENEESKRLASWHLDSNTITLKLYIKGSDPQDTYDKLRVLLKRLLKENTLEVCMWGATDSVFYHTYPVTPKLPDYAKKYIIDQNSMTDVTIEIPVDKEVKTSAKTITITPAHLSANLPPRLLLMDGTAAIKDSVHDLAATMTGTPDTDTLMSVTAPVIGAGSYTSCNWPTASLGITPGMPMTLIAVINSTDTWDNGTNAILMMSRSDLSSTHGWELYKSLYGMLAINTWCNGLTKWTAIGLNGTNWAPNTTHIVIAIIDAYNKQRIFLDGVEGFSVSDAGNPRELQIGTNLTIGVHDDLNFPIDGSILCAYERGVYDDEEIAAVSAMTDWSLLPARPNTAELKGVFGITVPPEEIEGDIPAKMDVHIGVVSDRFTNLVLGQKKDFSNRFYPVQEPTAGTQVMLATRQSGDYREVVAFTDLVNDGDWSEITGGTGNTTDWTHWTETRTPGFVMQPIVPGGPGIAVYGTGTKNGSCREESEAIAVTTSSTYRIVLTGRRNAATASLGATSQVSIAFYDGSTLLGSKALISNGLTADLAKYVAYVNPSDFPVTTTHIKITCKFNGFIHSFALHYWTSITFSECVGGTFEAVFPVESHRGKAFVSVGASFSGTTAYDDLTLQALMQTSEGEEITTSISPQVISLGDPDTKFKETFFLTRNKIQIPSHGVSSNADLTGIEELVRLMTDSLNAENSWGDTISLIYYDRAITEVSGWADKDYLIFDSRSSGNVLVSLDGTLNKAQAYDHTKWKNPPDFEADPDGINLVLLAVKDVDGDHQLNPVVTMSLVYNPTYLLVK